MATLTYLQREPQPHGTRDRSFIYACISFVHIHLIENAVVVTYYMLIPRSYFPLSNPLCPTPHPLTRRPHIAAVGVHLPPAKPGRLGHSYLQRGREILRQALLDGERGEQEKKI